MYTNTTSNIKTKCVSLKQMFSLYILLVIATALRHESNNLSKNKYKYTSFSNVFP